MISIPDSGNRAALGYAEASGIPYEIGMTRNHYVGRTFIQPHQSIRDFNVKVKLNPVKTTLEGKRVIVVDDSIVRGTTAKKRVSAIRLAGAKEVHLRICAPPIVSPCHFGVDMATKDELLAANMSVDQIKEFIGADSLGYLSQEGLLRSVKGEKGKYCMGCFTGKYPIPVQLEMDKLMLEA